MFHHTKHFLRLKKVVVFEVQRIEGFLSWNTEALCFKKKKKKPTKPE